MTIDSEMSAIFK